MKENDLFEIIGDIDDKKIEEAYSAKPRNKKSVLLKRLSFAACFVLVTVISLSLINEKDIKKAPEKEKITEEHENGEEEATDENFPQEKTKTSNGTEALVETERKEVTNNTEASADTERKEAENGVMKQESSFDEDSIVTDDAVAEDSSDYTSGGGGGGSSGGSASRKDSFSLDYLNSLNEKIKEQAAGEELSFIVSSCVNEDTNRVEVLVTSIKKDLIDKINALDTQGGAIEFKTVELQ